MHQIIRFRVGRSYKSFFFGITVGFLAGFLTFSPPLLRHDVKNTAAISNAPADWKSAATQRHCESKSKEVVPISTALTQYTSNDCDNHVIAEDLKSKVKILCWITTARSNLDTKMNAVRNTWAPRCNEHLFFVNGLPSQSPQAGESSNENLNWATRVNDVVYLHDAAEGRDYLFTKTILALHYLKVANYTQRFDWFVKVDDDAYIIVENLRLFVLEVLRNVTAEAASQSTVNLNSTANEKTKKSKVGSSTSESERRIEHVMNTPMYAGRIFMHDKVLYASGGGSYLLNTAAVHLVVHGVHSGKCDLPKSTDEDLELGRCLRTVGVRFLDSRDSFSEQRFLPIHPTFLLHPPMQPQSKWVSEYDHYPTHYGGSCCSRTTISFHYVTPPEMYLFDFLIYKLRPFGILPFYHSHASAYAATCNLTAANTESEAAASLKRHRLR